MAFAVFVMLPLEYINTPRDWKVEKHFIISKIIQKDTAHSLTVCTNTCVVFTFESIVTPTVLAPCATLSGTRRSGFQKHQRDLKRAAFKRSRALCSHRAGVAGFAHRAGVLAPGIFTDKWTVLAELAAAICIFNQAVSADAVPRQVIAMQGAWAAALQWLLLAVTAINHSRDGWSGSA